jgi:hypothetical protein
MNTHSPYSLQPWRQRQHCPNPHSVKAKEQNQLCFYSCLEKSGDLKFEVLMMNEFKASWAIRNVGMEKFPYWNGRLPEKLHFKDGYVLHDLD